jgi:hypothetical protein
MNIGLDARILSNPKCGIGNYVANITKELLGCDNSLRIFLFSDGILHDCYLDLLNIPNVEFVRFGSLKKEKKHWVQVFLPWQLKKYKIDIYHATWNNTVPFLRPCPCVLTIHDLAPWILGGHFRNKRKEFKYKIQHFLAARSADIVLTDSNSSRDDIIRLLRLKPSKVKTVYLGCRQLFEPAFCQPMAEQVLVKFNLAEKKYIIDPIGIDHPRRNPVFVLKGFHEFLQKTGKDYYLIFTGNYFEDNSNYISLKNEISALNLDKRVIITGWIPDEELFILLSNATVSVIPSLYEGFCLPLLESFACGTAVIATDRGSIPEIAQDAAKIIDPCALNNLSQALEQLISDDVYRSSLIERGKKRLEFFTWQKTAAKTLDVYKRL